jgi:hypothetical protein
MKARVKATGEIIEVKSKVITSLFTGKSLLKYVDQKTGISYFEEELFFPKDLADDPDYWTHLEHQYAGMAMQGMMAHTNIDYDEIVDLCVELAHALVEKLKEKEERK